MADDDCGGLKENVPHWEGPVRRYDFAGVGMALLEEVVTVGAGFEVYYAQNTVQRVSRLPAA